MSKIRSRSDLKDYILRKLGAPVIDINLADEQIDDAIQDSLLFFQEYHYEGVERVFIGRKITQDDINSKSIPTPDGVTSVVRVFKPFDRGFGMHSGDSLFSLMYHFYSGEIWQLTGQGGNLSNFFIMGQYIAQMNDVLNYQFRYRFQSTTDTLHIDTDWKRIFNVDDYIAYEAYKIIDPDQFTQIYDNWNLKALCVAEAKKQWAQNLSKYNGVQLPGGVLMNGAQMYQNAISEIEQIKEDYIQKFSEPLDLFIG